jgi:predicted nuclease of restriction endonuclease-like (RecB) superfamily
MSSNTVEKVQAKDLKEYKAFFKEIKEKILTSQVKAALAVNHELINLYWEIGSKIHLKQKDEGWGAKTIENLANDLKSSFPEMKGFSHRNLKYMVHFAKEYPISQLGNRLLPKFHGAITSFSFKSFKLSKTDSGTLTKRLNMGGVETSYCIG